MVDVNGMHWHRIDDRNSHWRLHGGVQMIRHFKQWLACRRLNKLVAKRANSFAVLDYKRRRAAMLKHTRDMA
jgi:hypothetical protein